MGEKIWITSQEENRQSTAPDAGQLTARQPAIRQQQPPEWKRAAPRNGEHCLQILRGIPVLSSPTLPEMKWERLHYRGEGHGTQVEQAFEAAGSPTLQSQVDVRRFVKCRTQTR